MKPLGVAIVGTGMVADLHQHALAQIDGVRLVGAYDRNRVRLEERVAKWGIRAYGSVEELLEDPQVEAVYVLTSSASHVEVGRQCLRAGRPILVEKPVAPEPGPIEELDREAGNASRVAMPAHNYAYMPEFQRLARLVRSGELGEIRGVWITYLLKHPEEVAAAYGGVLEEVMVHHTYLALALSGAPERVHAGIHPGHWVRHRAEDQAWMVWEYPGGSAAHLFASFAADDDSVDPWTFLVKVVGTEGSVSISWRSAVARNRQTPWFAHGFPIYEETYEREGEAFLQAVTLHRPPLSGLRDAAMGARIIDAAYEAARDHRVVSRDEAGGRW